MEPDNKSKASEQVSSNDAQRQPEQTETILETTPDQSPQQSITNRSELVSRARTFLSTPHIRSQDNAAKHAFLVDKGLTQDETNSLLREIVSWRMGICSNEVAHRYLAPTNTATDVSPASPL